MKSYGDIIKKIERELKENLLYESDFWPITEERLAKRFDVSRMPVRLVVTKLENENLVIRRNKTGTMPRVPKLDEMVQICELRLFLEPPLTYKATERIRDEEIKRLKEIVENCESYTLNSNLKLAAKKDVEFHTFIAELSGNAHGVDVLERLSILGRIFFAFAEGWRSSKKDNPHSHRNVLECLARRDASGAEKAMRNHLTWMRERLKHIQTKQRQKV